MQKAIEIVKQRIKELESIVGMTKVKISFAAQSRLTEAQKILELLKASS